MSPLIVFGKTKHLLSMLLTYTNLMHKTNARQRAMYARARAKLKYFAIGSCWLRMSYRIRCKSSRIRCMRFCCQIKFPQGSGHAKIERGPNYCNARHEHYR